jgi:enoyl-CoA hydratase/carnithine racemase
MPHEYSTIQIKKVGALDILTLNRPDALNALTREMISELQHYFGRLRDDFHTRAVILRGNGRGFCAGIDLKESNKGGGRQEEGKPVSADGRNGEGLSEVSKVLRGQRQLVNIFRKMREAPQVCYH